jgi:hypothetical protein
MSALPPIPPLPATPPPPVSPIARLRSTQVSLPVVLLCLAATFLFSLVVALVIALVIVLRAGGGSSPRPDYNFDKAFVDLGAEYGATMPEAYAGAWVAGARSLDRGSTVSASLLHVAKLWDAARKKAFDEEVSPRFNEVLPEKTPEKEIEPSQRRALAAAWRGFAAGLNGGTLPQAPPAPPDPAPTPKPFHADPAEPAKQVDHAVDSTPTTRVESVVQDVWRVRPSDPRIEDYGHDDGHGRFVTNTCRWRDGCQPRSN